MSSDNSKHLRAHGSHPRRFGGNELVYPVLSRRSGGISVGVNLNLDQSCNFRCIYCQVDRRESRTNELFSVERLERELRETLAMVLSGEVYDYEPFDGTPGELRRLNDIALSGDGEPTAAQSFGQASEVVARVKEEMGLSGVKIVVITNASLLHKEGVRKTLAMLDGHELEVWGKLDAGTEPYWKLVSGASVSLSGIVNNLLLTGQVRPLVIQSLFMRIDGKAVPQEEIEAYSGRLRDILSQGGEIKAVQLCTIARPPRESRVGPLSREELNGVATIITEKVDARIERYYGQKS